MDHKEKQKSFQDQHVGIVEDYMHVMQKMAIFSALLFKEQEEWQEQQQIMKKNQFPGEHITLNVGGMTFMTSKDTLTAKLMPLFGDESEHYFGALMSDNFTIAKDTSGQVLIDRDGTHFRYILNYLRVQGNFSQFYLPWSDKTVIAQLVFEAEFYNLITLKRVLQGDLVYGTLLIEKHWKYLRFWMAPPYQNKVWHCIYKGAIHGYTAASFHSICDNHEPTLIVVRSKSGILFGGFATQNWSGSGSKNSQGCWLFNLNLRIKQISTNHAQMNADSANGPIFGGTQDDLHIVDHCNIQASYSSQRYFNCEGNNPAVACIAQEKRFFVDEIEVYAMKQ